LTINYYYLKRYIKSTNVKYKIIKREETSGRQSYAARVKPTYGEKI
jgi:hypothetical protein